MKILLILLTVLLMVSCSTQQKPEPLKPEPIARVDVCKLDPAVCEKLCAGCSDQAACFANGGECQDTGTWFNDTGDVGPDVWTPGCHYQYTTQECVDGTFFLGDRCSKVDPKELIEWTISTCHPPNGDSLPINCDIECLKVQRGHGKCEVVPEACGSGKPSAVCKCDKPGPIA